jgi:hypothetical protein
MPIRIAWRIRGGDKVLTAPSQVSEYMAAVCKIVGVLQPVRHARAQMQGKPGHMGWRAAVYERQRAGEATSRLSAAATATRPARVIRAT